MTLKKLQLSGYITKKNFENNQNIYYRWGFKLEPSFVSAIVPAYQTHNAQRTKQQLLACSSNANEMTYCAPYFRTVGENTMGFKL